MNGQHDFTFQLVWQNLNDELKREVTHFWINEGALPNEAAAQPRLPQLMYLVHNNNGNIVAASSVYEQYNQQLRNHFYYMRAFIPTRFQESTLAEEIIVRIRDYFNAQFKAVTQNKNIGLMMEIVDKRQQQKYNDAIWGKSGMVFIGKTDSGAHQRVFYFDDTRIA